MKENHFRNQDWREKMGKGNNKSKTTHTIPCGSDYLDHIRLVAHFSDLRHVPHLLLDQRSFKRHQHGEGENAVVPILIQAPQAHAEHLEGNATPKLLRRPPENKGLLLLGFICKHFVAGRSNYISFCWVILPERRRTELSLFL